MWQPAAHCLLVLKGRIWRHYIRPLITRDINPRLPISGYPCLHFGVTPCHVCGPASLNKVTTGVGGRERTGNVHSKVILFPLHRCLQLHSRQTSQYKRGPVLHSCSRIPPTSPWDLLHACFTAWIHILLFLSLSWIQQIFCFLQD